KELLTHTKSVVTYCKMIFSVIVPAVPNLLHMEFNPAIFSSKLKSIGKQVIKNLLYPAPVSFHFSMFNLNGADKLFSRIICLNLKNRSQFLQIPFQTEVAVFNLQFSLFHLGHLQDIIDQAQE